MTNATVELLNRLWVVGDRAQVTCIAGYRFKAEASDEAKVECTAAGWENRQGCIKGEDVCILCTTIDKLTNVVCIVTAIKIMLMSNI